MRFHHVTIQQITLNWSSEAAIDEVGKRRAAAERRFRLYIHQLGVRVSLAMLLLSSAAVMLGRSSQISDSLTAIGLNICNGVPCFRGVMPGLTSWAEAQSLLSLPIGSQLSDERILVPLGADGRALIYPSIHQEVVEAIYISVSPEKRLMVGNMVELYGPPCGLTFHPQLSVLTMHYPVLSFDTTTMGSRLAMNAAVTHITLLDPSFYTPFDGDPCIEDISGAWDNVAINLPWHGFSSIR